jgi:hypothetical protein
VKEDTYPVHEHGWTCFHCGEHFPGTRQGERDARAHFSQVPSLPPECLDARSPMRKLARKNRLLGKTNREIARQRDEYDARARAAESEVYDLRLRLKCSRTGNLDQAVDYLLGEVEAAKAVVEYIEQRFPGIVAKARQSV